VRSGISFCYAYIPHLGQLYDVASGPYDPHWSQCPSRLARSFLVYLMQMGGPLMV